LPITDRQPTPEELAEALAYYKRTLDQRPDDEIMWMLYGNALSAAEKFSDAVTAYEKAATLKRPLPEVHYLLGVARMNAGDFGGAVAAFERHLQRFADVEVYVLASLCLDVEDERDRSKSFFEAAMRKDSARAMEYLKEYAQELVAAKGETVPDEEGTRAGLQAAIGHIDEYLKERKPTARAGAPKLRKA
jgi:tetratricopeptide (TPR) repeat protein